MSRKLIELTVGKARPAIDRDQVRIWFDDPQEALRVAQELIAAASDALRGNGDAGITLLGVIEDSSDD